MANITVNIVTEKKIVETEVQVKKYNLELTAEELVVLYHLSGSVVTGGRIRDICDSLYRTIQTKTGPIYNCIFSGTVKPTEFSCNTLDKTIYNMR